MEPADLLLRNGLVVTMNPGMDIIPDGAVAVAGDRIVDVGPTKELERRVFAKRVIHAAGSAVIPGLVNAHTHAPMSLFRGLADDLPLMDWLNRYIFPAETHLKPEWVRWGALLACAEMLLSGTTTFCDMYLFEQEVAEAARQAGMRALVGEVLYDFPSPNYGPIQEGFRYTEALIERWRGDPLVKIAVEPHAPFTCSPDLLVRARALANEHGVPLIIHLSETQNEVDQVQREYGRRPVHHLENLGVLDGPTVADHVVHVEQGEIEILSNRGVGVVHNPESNMKLASGVAPVPELLEKGIAVGLGTDGCASNNNLDLFGEMDTTAKLHKVWRQDPTVMDAVTVMKMSTILGARALGMDEEIGSIEPHKKADLVLVRLCSPHLVPMYSVISHLVYAACGSDVETVIVGGRILVEGRCLLTLPLDDIFQAVDEIARDIQRIVATAR